MVRSAAGVIYAGTGILMLEVIDISDSDPSEQFRILTL